MIKALFFCLLLIFAHTGIATPIHATEIANTRSDRPATIDRSTRNASERRFAIVIGNDSYTFQPLTTARADAQAIGDMLKGMGFEVAVVTDATQANLRDTVERLQQHREKYGTVLFYFAGHAASRDSSAWLLAIDTRNEPMAMSNGVEVADIVKALSPDASQETIVIIDACLTDPSSAPVTRSIPSALPPRTLLAYASAPGGNAYDAAGHGLFTAELLTLLPQPGLSLHDALVAADHRVRVRSAFAQNPWFYSTLTPAFSLVPEINPVRATWPPDSTLSLAVLGRPRGLLPQDGEAHIELEYWKSIENSTDAAEYEAYLNTYPKGRFSALAKARIERYKKSAEPAKPVSQTTPIEAKPAVEDVDLNYFANADTTLRKEPASTAAVVGRLSKGNPAHVTGRTADGMWYRVQTRVGSAYVAAASIAKTAPVAAIPVTAPSPSIQTPAAEKVSDAAKTTAIGKLQNQQDCPACPMLVVLPAGDFVMGDNGGDRSEKPAHRVSIVRPFAIGKTEVTTGQWRECVAAGQCVFKAETSGPAADSPVRDISWSDAQQYLRWLSQKTKQNYRLPTEAEWEYAARAGTTSRFWWGADVGSNHANCKNCGGAWNHATPELVTAFPANAFGLYGMNGSVWEWVSDCWYKSHDGAPADGSARGGEADCSQHVIRGGSWRDDATYVHSASRFNYDTDVRYLTNGFRVAKTLP